MQFSTTLSLLTLLSIANAAKEFGLLTIHSGSMLQYQGVVAPKDSATLAIEGSGAQKFTLNDDGTLTDSKGKKIGFTANGVATEEGGDIKASNAFGLDDINLTYNGKQIFAACPNKDKDGYVLTIGKCDGSTGVALMAASIKDVESKTLAGEVVTAPTSTASTKEAPKPTTTSEPSGSKFSVITIHSGTDFQYQSVKKVDSHPHVFAVGGSEGKGVEFQLQKDGSLLDQDGRAIYVDPSTGEVGNVDPFGALKPTTGFAITDGHLTFKSKSGFFACPSGGNRFSLTNKDCTGGTGIVLHVVE